VVDTDGVVESESDVQEMDDDARTAAHAECVDAYALSQTEPESIDISAGEYLYASTCAACHGPNLMGTDNGPNLAGLSTEDRNYRVVCSALVGFGAMRPQDVTEVEAVNITAWVSTFWSPVDESSVVDGLGWAPADEDEGVPVGAGWSAGRTR
jgi:mono/diheme cytochrome c family protein